MVHALLFALAAEDHLRNAQAWARRPRHKRPRHLPARAWRHPHVLQEAWLQAQEEVWYIHQLLVQSHHDPSEEALARHHNDILHVPVPGHQRPHYRRAVLDQRQVFQGELQHRRKSEHAAAEPCLGRVLLGDQLPVAGCVRQVHGLHYGQRGPTGVPGVRNAADPQEGFLPARQLPRLVLVPGPLFEGHVCVAEPAAGMFHFEAFGLNGEFLRVSLHPLLQA
mmetsp:Transcript_29046/g.79741  ORF Transcript_29046/g.79741 Transcript_29046/m.79741 type:complete len:222 (+) Transcript_29046:1172-1837(+)